MTRIIFILTALTGMPAQSQDPLFGTWILNLAKSTADRDVRYKKVTTKIGPWEDGLKVMYDLVGVRGGVTHMKWIGKFDGKDYPVQGVDYVLTNAYSRVNDRTYEIVNKIDGVMSSTGRVTISSNGKTLTTVTTGKNARGNTVTTTSVYERQ